MERACVRVSCAGPTRRTLGCTTGTTGRVGRPCVKARRLLLTLERRCAKITKRMLTGDKMRSRGVLGLVSRLVAPTRRRPTTGKGELRRDPELRCLLRGDTGRYGELHAARVKARRLLLTVVHSISYITTGVLVALGIGLRGLFRDVVGTTKVSPGVCRRRLRRSGHKDNTVVRRCYASLARHTTRKGVSPIIKEGRRVCHLVRVLDQEAGGGPYLIKRPKINGATVVRNLTREVTSNIIPRGVGSGGVCDLSLPKLVTNSGCHNRFRRHVGNLVSRMRTYKGMVLFLSRVRAVVNTKNTRKTVSTSDVLGPSLTENRVRLVNTAAVTRCQGCVRGSTTLRQEFRPIAVRRPARRRYIRVLGNLGRGCRTRRGIIVRRRTLRSTMRLSRHCVASQGLPSGTVSILSRTYSGMDLGKCRIPRGLGRLRRTIGRLTSRGRRDVRQKSFTRTSLVRGRRSTIRGGLSSIGGHFRGGRTGTGPPMAISTITRIIST